MYGYEWMYGLDSTMNECMDHSSSSCFCHFLLTSGPKTLQRLDHLYSSFSCHLLAIVQQDWKIMINKCIHYSVWELDDLVIENQEVTWKKENIKKVIHFVARKKKLRSLVNSGRRLLYVPCSKFWEHDTLEVLNGLSLASDGAGPW